MNDRAEELRYVLAVEWKSPHHHRVEDHSRTPHVRAWTGVRLSRNDLGRGIVRRSTRGREESVGRLIRRHAVVGQLERESARGRFDEEEVLKLDVAVTERETV